MHRNRAGTNTVSATDLPRWQVGMQVRGGRLTHTMAQAGTVVFVGFGALATFVALILSNYFPRDDGLGLDLSQVVFAGVIVLAPIGAGVFALVGRAVQSAARVWLSSAPPIVSATDQKAQTLAERVGEAGVRPGSRWEQHYERCVRSVIGFHAIVHELPTGAAKNWFDAMGQTLDVELAEALRLARLGDNLEGSSNPEAGLSSAGWQTDAQMQIAADAFEQTTARAGEIVLDLRDESDFARVQAQLDVLAEQTPQLRTAGRR